MGHGHWGAELVTGRQPSPVTSSAPQVSMFHCLLSQDNKFFGFAVEYLTLKRSTQAFQDIKAHIEAIFFCNGRLV